MLAVEAAMRAYAHNFGEDKEKWGITGGADLDDHIQFVVAALCEESHPLGLTSRAVG